MLQYLGACTVHTPMLSLKEEGRRASGARIPSQTNNIILLPSILSLAAISTGGLIPPSSIVLLHRCRKPQNPPQTYYKFCTRIVEIDHISYLTSGLPKSPR